MKIKRFIFNPIEENCYVLSDEGGESVIIDAGCWTKEEEDELTRYVDDNGLKVTHLLNTHLHFDHIFGNQFVLEKYGVKTEAHQGDAYLLNDNQMQAMGIPKLPLKIAPVGKWLEEGDEIVFGKQKLRVLHTPGHSPGGVCYYCEKEDALFSGDTLFRMSMGRTDFPNGSQENLINSIRQKLMKLPANTVVFPGHGPTTTIGEEIQFNPYI